METLARADLPPMTADEFEEWSQNEEGRWELLAGVPVRMQAESRVHSRTSHRIKALLAARLAGHSCTPDERVDVLCGEHEIRQPDVLIDCAPEAAESDSPRAFRPTVVFEIAVTSQAYDLGAKHLVYFQNPDVQHYVVVMPIENRVVHFPRGEASVILGPEDVLALTPEPGLEIGVGELLG